MMTDSLSPIWPSRLHHIRINSEQPGRLVDFYREGLGLSADKIGDGVWALTGPDRRLLIGHGRPGRIGFAAFTLSSSDQLTALAARLEAAGIPPEPFPDPLLDGDAFMVRDPDGNALVFGLPAVSEPEAAGVAPPGRLQHFVVASTRLAEMIAFYAEGLGLLVSDTVHDSDGAVTASFLRTDPEHHSFAVFRAPEARLDHHAYEVNCWDDIRDWADHFADLRVPLWWGPGRHGVGNNLFFMVEDPDGNKVELSAELEICPPDKPPGDWPHDERSLNLWGSAWMRS